MTYQVHDEYFEILGYKLAKAHFGKPTNPSMEINPEKSSFQIPQAWSQDIAGETHWFYNLPGAEAEAETLGVTIPTLEEFLQICATIPGDAIEKAQKLNMPLNGYRNMNTGEIVSQ